ncbi:glycoside hydrolase family 99-like domain-containing protein [Alcaligenaceae bacterium]|nr:glycoside hydrolase family 99-like domain-containing protein [Alcaligenaceae bacterium]
MSEAQHIAKQNPVAAPEPSQAEATAAQTSAAQPHTDTALTPQALEEQQRHILKQYAIFAHRSKQRNWLLRALARRYTRYFTERRAKSNDKQRILASGLFDVDWYLDQNPDVRHSGQDALEHYVRYGGFEGRDPSRHFDTLAWLQQHPGLIEQQIHPLIHYIDQLPQAPGPVQGRRGNVEALYKQLIASASQPSEEHVAASDHHLSEPSRLRAIAFYLPQFHPFLENDTWWGKGFTEWTNVSKAVPQFVGHYQPRLPGELGFYDLRLPQIQERQVELARQYGLSAFCFHYYWFTGRRRLLELPLDQYVANPNIDFPFCICWANENWTRRWDGQEQDILMEQRHEPQDDLEFIEDVAPLLRDPRYLRVDGKPLLIVYRINLLPNPRRTVETWRNYCREQGIGELHLVVAQSFGIGAPQPYGFDAAVEFPPHGIHIDRQNRNIEFINPDFRGNVYEYSHVVESQLAKDMPEDYVLYRSVFPSWDNEARKPERGHVFHNASPELYLRWLGGICDQTDKRDNPDQKLVFINAWNEWAEGAYLEPDRRYGYAYLQATQQTLAHYPPPQAGLHAAAEVLLGQAKRQHDTAVILHLFYPELWPEIRAGLAHLDSAYDLYVSVPDTAQTTDFAQVLADVPGATLLPFPNRGRDVAPFLTILKGIQPLGYRQVCKLHAKRSLHRADGDRWRHSFLDQLLGSQENVQKILQAFAGNDELGMVGPYGHWLNYAHYWGYPASRPDNLRELAIRMGVSPEDFKRLHFFAGSMFWCRPDSLAPMFNSITPDAFDVELGQIDGTLAHELERLFAGVCQSTGMKVTDNANLHGQPHTVRMYAFAAPSPPMVAGGAAVEWQERIKTQQRYVRLREIVRRIPYARRIYHAIRSM